MTWLRLPAAVITKPAGQSGLKGDKGDKGDPGNQGVKGDTGAPGISGVHYIPPGAASGSYLSAITNAIALTTIAGAANRLDFYPFVPSKTIVVSELAIEVTTAVASSLARVGIYSSTVAGLPGDLLTGAGTELSCAATGAKTSATSITLTAGVVYWLAVLSSSTQTYRGIPLSAMLSLGNAATGAAVYSLLRVTRTYASGLPNPAPVGTLTSAIAPFVRLKLA